MVKKEIASVAESGRALERTSNILPLRILVVDDDCDLRQLTEELLTSVGFRVKVVNDGAAGWEALQAGGYDLVITDNKMPRMAGVEMIKQMRAAGMTIPLIMATGQLPTHEFELKP